MRLFEKMQQFQFDSIDLDQPLESHVRTLTEEDIDRCALLPPASWLTSRRLINSGFVRCRIRRVQTMEELRDVYQHFLLYYGSDIPKMKAWFRQKQRREKEKAKEGLEAEGEEGAEKPPEEDVDDVEGDTLKQASRRTGYDICVKAGLGECLLCSCAALIEW